MANLPEGNLFTTATRFRSGDPSTHPLRKYINEAADALADKTLEEWDRGMNVALREAKERLRRDADLYVKAIFPDINRSVLARLAQNDLQRLISLMINVMEARRERKKTAKAQAAASKRLAARETKKKVTDRANRKEWSEGLDELELPT